MPTIVVAPFNVAGFPEGGGHFWVYLQYVLGLRRLGCDVYWLEAVRAAGPARQRAVVEFRARAERWGLGGRLILYVDPAGAGSAELPPEYLAMGRDEAEELYDRADLLLNFHYAMSPGLLARFRRTALVDIDPGLLQFWIARGQLNVAEHDLHFTTGERVGAAGPDGGRQWIPIRPPVSLEHWPYVFDPQSVAFTTVSSWDSSDWVVDDVEKFENTKRVAFLPFADLPRLTGQPLELALFLKKERDGQDRLELERQGWRIRDSREIAATPLTYRAYIQQSRGEFSCAKRSCTRFQNGWVSDRTLCYLASGKPVVIQDTGPSAVLPDGEGVFRFKTPEQAARAFASINADYERHCRAARSIVEQHFDASQVLQQLLARALG